MSDRTEAEPATTAEEVDAVTARHVANAKAKAQDLVRQLKRKVASPPTVHPAWSATGWFVFWAGAVIALAGMAWLAFPDWDGKDLIRKFVTFAIPGTFLATMINTFRAARGFGRRKKGLNEWLQFVLDPDFSSRECRKAIAKLAPGWPQFHEDLGRPGHAGLETHWDFVPVPYRVASKSRTASFGLGEYVELIAKECRDARFEAGRQATALGGVTIFLIQLFARLCEVNPS